METVKTITLSTAIVVAFAIVLMIIQLILRKAKSKIDEDGKIQRSFCIWFVTLLLSGTFIIAKMVAVFSEAVDNIYKINPSGAVLESFKTGALFTGLSIVWLLLWYFIANILSVLNTGKRNEANEVAADNYVFFLIRGMVLIGLSICLLPVFEIILRAFLPGVQVLFYH
ncbi:hypothetical protein [Niabella drilacis]|uniref:Uncharacterized protein n=1 Tax=Niabella drilacis (strain DSM 25811 / CCM 8410 / CCUG 62505 / LMG 26954 / E90) TaxID=1285928 RepID=A0A1G6PLC7_NIADE|nr:hypothetical protein [Niabella drilacis]SDC80165.1 hypothetical protein SAMN04487894_10456 [Niabella drilacis]